MYLSFNNDTNIFLLRTVEIRFCLMCHIEFSVKYKGGKLANYKHVSQNILFNCQI